MDSEEDDTSNIMSGDGDNDREDRVEEPKIASFSDFHFLWSHVNAMRVAPVICWKHFKCERNSSLYATTSSRSIELLLVGKLEYTASQF